MRLFVLFALLVVASFAKSFEFDFVNQMPVSREKDYYIWRFLLQDSTDKEQAIEVVKGAKALNGKLKKAYLKKTGHYPTLSKKPKKKATKAQKEAWRHKVATSKKVKSSLNPMQELLKNEANMQTFIFNSASKAERKKFNHILTPNQYKKLTRSPHFNRSIELIEKENLKYLKKSFLFSPSLNNALRFTTLFNLALNALQHNKQDIAIVYFGEARKKAKKRYYKDQASFWLYLLTKENIYLNSLVKSYDINIYTLLARDKLRLQYPSTITSKFAKKRNKHYDITDPIAWANLKEKIFDHSIDKHKLAQDFKSRETIAHFSYIKARAYNYKKHYYPMPYRDVMHHLSKERQALIYAIARQESFCPCIHLHKFCTRYDADHAFFGQRHCQKKR